MDIAGLVTHFVKQFSVSMNKDIRRISDRAMRSMTNHSWPGNVRELQNYVARGVILARGTTLDLVSPDKRVTVRAEPTSEKLEDTIRGEILAACHKANWQIGGPRGAAARLGLKRTTLFYKMKRLGISPPAKPS
jgi:DNA-binding NtrC family response regulator